MLQKIKKIFENEGTGLYINTYEVIVASEDSGFLEFCEDSLSLHQIKKQFPKKSLREIYELIFEDDFEQA